MAFPAIITAGVSIFQGAQTLLGGAGDADRLAANQKAYDAAVAGDDNALLYLKARSQQGVFTNVPGYGSISGWATATARADAAAKYAQAQQARAVNAVAQQAGAEVQDLAGRAGYAIIPTTQAEFVRWVVLAAVVALGLFLVWKVVRRFVK
jgi:hypothetical protein